MSNQNPWDSPLPPNPLQCRKCGSIGEHINGCFGFDEAPAPVASTIWPKACPGCGFLEIEGKQEHSDICKWHRASGSKDTNPKDAIGIAKVPRSTTSARVFAEVGLAMLEGALKYGRHNYRVAGVRASVYYDAVDRHLSAWWEGQDIDPVSGLSHVTKAIAGLMVLRDSMLQGNWNDDRPPKTSDLNWVDDLNKKTEALLAKFPDPKEPFTEKGQTKK